MENKKILGHFAALLTIVIWGTTFISTKILLAVAAALAWAVYSVSTKKISRNRHAAYFDRIVPVGI